MTGDQNPVVVAGLGTQRRFDPTEYWQERLAVDYSLGSTGWKTLGEAFNEWSYAVRARVFTHVAEAVVPAPREARVLDVGSGTGFYLDLWQRIGVREITGSDLTPVAVERLAQRYPAATIRQVDIGQTNLSLRAGAYDAISIMDVLYHIVDDERYRQALANLATLLTQEGALLLSENLVSRPSRAVHQVTRSREWILGALAQAGLVVVREQPIFFLMNTPVSSDSRLLHRWWHLITRLVPRHEVIGWTVGAALFPIEIGLARLAGSRRSPSTTLLVCRRRLA
jgi:2-polyprenyl-3-methyl-5-hydroxy-6-metoxy-1,4-benzoquinol methylase